VGTAVLAPSTMTPNQVKEKIAQMRSREAALIRSVANHDYETEFTEDELELTRLERRIRRWEAYLKALELYEAAGDEIKTDSDIKQMWAHLERSFPWAEEEPSDAAAYEKAALKAMMNPTTPAVHDFMRELVFIQNSAPWNCDILPAPFVHTVVRLGLMNRDAP
jgi:hypothetical protein